MNTLLSPDITTSLWESINQLSYTSINLIEIISPSEVCDPEYQKLKLKEILSKVYITYNFFRLYEIENLLEP